MHNDSDHLFSVLADLNQRLGVMISLLLRIVPRGEQALSLREQVKILSDLGVRPRDIAYVLARTQTHINKELTGLRKVKAKAKK